MRPFNQKYLDDILKFVNKYYQENRVAPTLNMTEVSFQPRRVLR